MTQVFGGSRYSLTYEQWLDLAVQDPEGYGMTNEQVVAERELHYSKKTDEELQEVSKST